MQRISASTNTDLNDQFTEGDPQAGTPPTQITQEFLNALQEEIAGFVEHFGITLDAQSNAQLVATLAQGWVWGSPTGGDQGAGSGNFELLYENGNRVVTDYVFDAHIDGAIDYDHYDGLIDDSEVETEERTVVTDEWNEEKQAYVRREVVERRVVHDEYPVLDEDDNEIGRRRVPRKLPAMARCEDNLPAGRERASIGGVMQALLETCEVQAVHIASLEARIRALETS